MLQEFFFCKPLTCFILQGRQLRRVLKKKKKKKKKIMFLSFDISQAS